MEKTFCEQLKGMGWDWLDGDTDVPELTERENFRIIIRGGRGALHGPMSYRVSGPG